MIDLEQHWKDRAVVDGATLQLAILKLHSALMGIREAKGRLWVGEFKNDGRDQFPILLAESECEILEAEKSLERAYKNLNNHMTRYVSKKSVLFHKDYPEVYLADLITEMVNRLDNMVNKINEKDGQ